MRCILFVDNIDDFSKKVWIFFLKQKIDMSDTFKEQKTMIQQTTKQVKHLHTDNSLGF